MDLSFESRLLERALTPQPSPEAQLTFLTKLQRLFAEGDFTATYKFALLIALADLAVEQGRDDGEAMRLSTRQIADKFVGLYWQQCTPYSSGRPGTVTGILMQNAGSQAAVINLVVAFRERHPVSSPDAASLLGAEFRALISAVASVVSAQPLTYLQNMGGQTDPFLYEREHGGIVLKPGVTYCLRRFQTLVQQLARSHWMDHVKRNRYNAPFLGDASDLEQYLFETSRQALGLIGVGLRKLTGQRCFYCESPVGDADVDHFIPFSLYPRDLVHNFVLTHGACNRSKSDTLAAKPHLERWIAFADQHSDDLTQIGSDAGVVGDISASRAVTTWSYKNALSGGALAWLRPKTYEPIDSTYIDCLD